MVIRHMASALLASALSASTALASVGFQQAAVPDPGGKRAAPRCL
jgi:hypothetical protein